MMSSDKSLASLHAVIAALLVVIPLQVRAQTVDFAPAADATRVILKLRADSPMLRQQVVSGISPAADRAKALGRRLGIAMNDGAAISERMQVVSARGLSSSELAQRLTRESDVEYAVPDERRRILTAPNDPLYGDGVGGSGPAVGQWYLRAPSGAVTSSLDIEVAWNITLGDPGVVVAVLDTGVRYDHPDLLAVAAGGHLLPGYDMVSDIDMANDGDGRDADASDPGDWISAAETGDPAGPFHGCPV